MIISQLRIPLWGFTSILLSILLFYFVGTVHGIGNDASLTRTLVSDELIGDSLSANGQPIIEVWYGLNQSFGPIGTTQSWVNILGNVSDPDGVNSLVYSLNGGSKQSLSIGPDSRRLQILGDFNIDLDLSDLIEGVNEVVITASDTLDNQSIETVIVNYESGNVWPLPYSIDWASVTNIQDVAQVVDGKWSVGPDGLRTEEPGYDRLVAIGDISWTDYEVTVPITIHSANNSGAVGVLMRWQGHTDSPVVCAQPKCGWIPNGNIGWWRFFNPVELQWYRPYMNQPFTPTLGTTYLLKLRVESTPGLGGYYSLKAWEEGQPEPIDWNLELQEDQNDLASGSIMLIAHNVDATFGNVSVTLIGGSEPPVISNIQAAAGETSATITWDTDEPATSSVAYGLSTAYENGSVSDSALVTGHAIALTGLLPDKLYHNQVTSVDGSGNAAASGDLTFTTGGGAVVLGITSDDFSSCSLDTGIWTIVDPLGDAAVTMNGSVVEIGVPGGINHDAWTVNESARIMQTANDVNFEVEAKFDSAVSERYQEQGILVEQDGANYLRFDFYSDGTASKIYAASFTNGSVSAKVNSTIADGAPLYMRVGRVGDQWTMSYSYDGTNWTTGVSFVHSLAVSSVGPFAGNYGAGTSAPAHVAVVDYFFDTATPVTPENDGPKTLIINMDGIGSVGKEPDQAAFACNETVTLIATAAVGWDFDGWSGDARGSENPLMLTMDADKKVTATFVLEPDTVPPVLSNIEAAAGETSATVTWDTDELATSSVAYGVSAAYENGRVSDDTLVTEHVIMLTGLQPGALYHYQVTSEDGSGNSAISGDLIFTTLDTLFFLPMVVSR